MEIDFAVNSNTPLSFLCCAKIGNCLVIQCQMPFDNGYCHTVTVGTCAQRERQREGAQISKMATFKSDAKLLILIFNE
jgi:hypothetical protein